MKNTTLILLALALASCEKDTAKPSGQPPSTPAPQEWTGETPEQIHPAPGATNIWTPIRWEWTEVPGATRYEVYATTTTYTGQTNGLLNALNLTSSPYIQNTTPSAIHNGAASRWRIRAVGEPGQASAWSDWVEFTLGQ